jgi:hypothetical protein
MSMPMRMIAVAMCVASAGCVVIKTGSLTSSGLPDERMAPLFSYPLTRCPTSCAIEVSVVPGSPNSIAIGAADVFVYVPHGRSPDVTWQLKIPSAHENAFRFDPDKGIDFGPNAASFPCTVKTPRQYKCSVRVSPETPPATYKYTIRVVAAPPQGNPEPLDPFFVIE